MFKKMVKDAVIILVSIGVLMFGQYLPLMLMDKLNVPGQFVPIGLGIFYPVIVIGIGYLIHRFLIREKIVLLREWHFS